MSDVISSYSNGSLLLIAVLIFLLKSYSLFSTGVYLELRRTCLSPTPLILSLIIITKPSSPCTTIFEDLSTISTVSPCFKLDLS